MSVLSRFSTIVSANVNALLDRAEDPAKMVDQYLRDLNRDLAEVRKETAGVMAEEARTKRLYDANVKEVARFTGLAQAALIAGNEEDARVFLGKKQELAEVGETLQKAYEAASGNANRMRQMHDKLVTDINSLQARRQSIKATVAVARTQERVANLSGGQSDRAMGAFSRAEDRANEMLDRANAMSALNTQPVDEASALAERYSHTVRDTAVDAELEEMKRKLGIEPK